MPKKKVSKKTKPSCGNCKYHALLQSDANLGNCHRYPQTSKSYTSHWCGEFQPVGPNQTTRKRT